MGAHRHQVPSIPEPEKIRENTGGVVFWNESWHPWIRQEITSFPDEAVITLHAPEYWFYQS